MDQRIPYNSGFALMIVLMMLVDAIIWFKNLQRLVRLVTGAVLMSVGIIRLVQDDLSTAVWAFALGGFILFHLLI